MNLNEQLKALYTQQVSVWETARKNVDGLSHASIKTFSFNGFKIEAQFNPARVVSSGAKVDTKTIQERKCFLCNENRPSVQEGIVYKNKFEILINPFPILPYHFTIPNLRHVPQEILPYFSDMLGMAKELTEFTILYNGPSAGASAPDHMHFQAVGKNHLPIENEFEKLKASHAKTIYASDSVQCYSVNHYLRSCIVIESADKQLMIEHFNKIYFRLQKQKDQEPMMNVFCLYKDNRWVSFIFPRRLHRPRQYFAQGDENILISPGAVDMAGVLVMPRESDFEKINATIIEDIYNQVSKKIEDPLVSVGIMSADKIHFVLNKEFTANGKTYTGEQYVFLQNGTLIFDGASTNELILSPVADNADFELKDVTIGIGFHWERKEDQCFSGSLKFILENGTITAINILPVEDYLKSVISSEMSASASLELLKAHAVISRSWLLANMDGENKTDHTIGYNTAQEHIKWYERDAHARFDVCADDHCQRYQGITRTTTKNAVQAVEETQGEVLVSDGKICDARFSKSCGGMSEKFENCWAEVPHSYLTNIVDNDTQPENFNLDLTVEENAKKWILQSPPAFCNTTDKKILSQVLNNYDQETTDFYRWKVTYAQEELSALIKKRSGIDFGHIIDLVPVERGESARLIKLKIVGTKKTLIVGKELEIRKWLSESHLYSSAFVIDKIMDNGAVPVQFILHGAGWGHGVGLCQIGAAVMGEKGYDYKQILQHYYKGSELRNIWTINL